MTKREKYLNELKMLRTTTHKIERDNQSYIAKIVIIGPQPLLDSSWGIDIYKTKNDKRISYYLSSNGLGLSLKNFKIALGLYRFKLK